jgi:hypothetical protein
MRGILGLVTDLVFGTPKILAVPSYKYARVPTRKKMEDAHHASTCRLRCRIRCFVSFVGVHRRSGEQVSETSSSAILHRKRANKVFGKRSARLLERFRIDVLYVLVAMARFPPRRWGTTRRRQARGGADRRRRLLYPVIPVRLETYSFLSVIISFIPSICLSYLV